MAAMTKQEMTRAMTLLEEDDLEELAKIKVGRSLLRTGFTVFTKRRARPLKMPWPVKCKHAITLRSHGSARVRIHLGFWIVMKTPVSAFTITTRLEGLHRPICWNIKKLRSAPCFQTGISTHTRKSIRSISKWVWSRTVETRPR